MKITTVRYRIAPDRVHENIRLVREVFSQLRETSPAGLRYACLTPGDGSFMHIACGDEGVLTSLQSFQEFRADFHDRAIEPATFTGFEVVGNFSIF